MTNNESRAQVERIIAFKRICIKKAEKAAEIIRKMDGKVLNVRLQNALNADESYPSYYIVTIGDVVEIQYRYTGREFWMLRVPREQRINATAYLENLQMHIELLREEITDLELTMMVIDERIEQIKRAVTALNALTTSLPYAVQEAYGIPNKIYF